MKVNLEEMQKYILWLKRRVKLLEEENRALKGAVKIAVEQLDLCDDRLREVYEKVASEPLERERSWPEKSEKLKGVRSLTLKAVVKLIKARNSPVHTRDVVNYVKSKYPDVVLKLSDQGSETIPRRLRELKEMGYLTSPREGWWFVGPKLKGRVRVDESKSGIYKYIKS